MRRLAALALALAALTPGAVAAAAPSGATGDAATISLYRGVAANANAKRAEIVSQSGFLGLAATRTAKPTIAYVFGQSPLPEGFRGATETITLTQAKGAVAWLTDVLRAPGAPVVELFVTRAAAFAGLVTGPKGAVACFDRVRFTTVPYRAGGPWWSAVGQFRPMVQHGNQILVTVTYAWADGRHVTEVDSVDASRQLFTGSSLHVAARSASGLGPMGITQHVRYLVTTPSAPSVHLCR